MTSFQQKPIKRQTLTFLMRESFRRVHKKRAIEFLRNGSIETDLSYDQLDRDSDSVAGRFMEMGMRKGDCAILFLPKCVHWVISHIALMKIGATCVPLNPGFKKEEVRFFIQQTKPALAVAGDKQSNIIEEIAPDVSIHRIDTTVPYESPTHPPGTPSAPESGPIGLDDPALIVFTSGTTGQPKGAVLTQGNLSHDAQNVIGIWEISDRDTFCHALPLFHVHGLCFGLHTSLLAGATIIMLDAFDPEIVMNTLSHKITTMFMAVPTIYSRLLGHPRQEDVNYSHLRLLTSGSAPLLEKDFMRITHAFGNEPVEREGMSETLMNFSNPLRGRRKPGSIGLPLPFLQARIVDPETFEDVSAGDVGEIWLKSPAITPGYWKDPEETGRAFVNGWFRTGDLGRRDQEGYYYLTDRIKHIIISGGENISPREIEGVINLLDDVEESAVVGIPDEEWGETVAAAVAVKRNSRLTPQEITSACKERLLNWKCPRTVLIVDELPKNQMGKILRDEVKNLFC
jgi:malonyl-CoA/methylmalonyl-CoA synthetase